MSEWRLNIDCIIENQNLGKSQQRNLEFLHQISKLMKQKNSNSIEEVS